MVICVKDIVAISWLIKNIDTNLGNQDWATM